MVEPARSDDGDAIASIAHAHLPPAAAERLLAYWAAARGTFRVSRDADGAVAAFASIFELEDVSGALLTRDPVAAVWREHHRRAPMPRGQRALHVRHELSRESGTSPSVASAALWLDIKRDYLELRPALRRVYIAATDVATMAPALAPLGFAPLADDAMVVDGVAVTILLNDMGPASVDGWLGDVVGRELQAAEDGVLDAGPSPAGARRARRRPDPPRVRRPALPAGARRARRRARSAAAGRLGLRLDGRLERRGSGR